MATYADLPPSPPAFGTAFAVRTAIDGYQALDSNARKRDAKGKGRAEDEEEEVDVVEGEESGLEQQPLANLVRSSSVPQTESIVHDFSLTGFFCFCLEDLQGGSSHGGNAADRVSSVGGVRFGPLGREQDQVSVGRRKGSNHPDPDGRQRCALCDSVKEHLRRLTDMIVLADDSIASFSTTGAEAQPSSQPMNIDSPTPAQPLSSRKPHRKTEDRFLAELGIDPSQTASLLATPTRTTRRASTVLPTTAQGQGQGQGQAQGRQRSSMTYVDLKPRTRADTSTHATSVKHEHEREHEMKDASGRTDEWDPCWCGDEGDELDMVGCDGQNCKRFMHGAFSFPYTVGRSLDCGLFAILYSSLLRRRSLNGRLQGRHAVPVPRLPTPRGRADGRVVPAQI